MYALLEIKGKQYKAVMGEILKIDKIEANEGDKLEFDSVMLVNKGGDVKIGKPYIFGSCVKCTYVEAKKDKKVISYRYRRRKSSERKVGHRQSYSYILVDNIIVS
ncbi:50S ribosomal protein L21 [Borrelia miyamotoi]|uniref:Large ribosomal subunit protein bL21 n=1 Tax=Borrelia miyamotoi TaxID=47466 RepID=A0AAP8YTR0_9SPIR|nr:50S ribosomal protein L21 [Borrelia miyamotoi]ATQ14489.1 50S ribosomal protein L21 [Borrelia miyamotoi]ATQ15674.1 50S ribosomal protein L21 [Borrelia miyamotoi]ATQ16818.1 50S ribosomal protein L21 [Borrelia miyamotoi]ATQ18679.1 50S ribosomal protein L21 [Borrelia miyamotoi]ATQ19315.1 50S ribosomal protein L21 [Borrelia miyamotoi]